VVDWVDATVVVAGAGPLSSSAERIRSTAIVAARRNATGAA
jgi:hypothetical protein